MVLHLLLSTFYAADRTAMLCVQLLLLLHCFFGMICREPAGEH